MITTRSQWYRTLDPAKKRAIRELHRINPYWNLVGLLFVAAWFVTGTAVVLAPAWYWRLPGYVLIGLLIHGMSNFMHEGIHGTLFKNRRWDHWFGFLMGAPSLFAMTAYGVNHLLHHKHTRTDKDPDNFYNFSDNPATLSVMYYAWLAFGMLFYSVRVPWVAVKHGSRKDYSHMAVERTLLSLSLLALVGSAWWFGFFSVLVHVWIIPLAVASLLGNVRGWAEHTQTVSDHPLTETRTVTSNRLFSFLNINLNYHIEHHLFPGVPWYNLPRVHALLLDDYKAAGSSIYGSYTHFLFDAFRTGIHGLAPNVPPREHLDDAPSATVVVTEPHEAVEPHQVPSRRKALASAAKS